MSKTQHSAFYAKITELGDRATKEAAHKILSKFDIGNSEKSKLFSNGPLIEHTVKTLKPMEGGLECITTLAGMEKNLRPSSVSGQHVKISNSSLYFEAIESEAQLRPDEAAKAFLLGMELSCFPSGEAFAALQNIDSQVALKGIAEKCRVDFNKGLTDENALGLRIMSDMYKLAVDFESNESCKNITSKAVAEWTSNLVDAFLDVQSLPYALQGAKRVRENVYDMSGKSVDLQLIAKFRAALGRIDGSQIPSVKKDRSRLFETFITGFLGQEKLQKELKANEELYQVPEQAWS